MIKNSYIEIDANLLKQSVGKRNNIVGKYGEKFIGKKCCPKCGGKILLIDEPSVDFRCLKCNKNYEVKCIKESIYNDYLLKNRDSTLIIRAGKYEQFMNSIFQRDIDILLIIYRIVKHGMLILKVNLFCFYFRFKYLLIFLILNI